MSLVECITATKDVVLAIAAAVTAIVAYKGIEKWKLELRGKAEFETASALIRSTYKVRDALASFRVPFIAPWEFPDGYAEKIPNSGLEDAKALAHAYDKRFKLLNLALQEFDAATLEGEILWGNELTQKTSKLKKCAREVNTAAITYIRNVASKNEFFSGRDDLKAQTESKIWDHGDNSEFNRRISDAIIEIETLLRTHMKRS